MSEIAPMPPKRGTLIFSKSIELELDFEAGFPIGIPGRLKPAPAPAVFICQLVAGFCAAAADQSVRGVGIGS